MKTQKNKGIRIPVLLLSILALIPVGMLIFKSPTKSEATRVEMIQPASENNAQVEKPTKPEQPATAQKDLSVIVTDRGASFVIAPLSAKSPVVVPESAVRAMQKQQK